MESQVGSGVFECSCRAALWRTVLRKSLCWCWAFELSAMQAVGMLHCDVKRGCTTSNADHTDDNEEIFHGVYKATAYEIAL